MWSIYHSPSATVDHFWLHMYPAWGEDLMPQTLLLLSFLGHSQISKSCISKLLAFFFFFHKLLNEKPICPIALIRKALDRV